MREKEFKEISFLEFAKFLKRHNALMAYIEAVDTLKAAGGDSSRKLLAYLLGSEKRRAADYLNTFMWFESKEGVEFWSGLQKDLLKEYSEDA